jgi:DNA-binding transcriptional regulator GbsR (MarR family)
MQLSEAKEKYIQTWGTFATNWGINRTMAQVHACFWQVVNHFLRMR